MTLTSNLKSVKDREMVVRALHDAVGRARQLAKTDPAWAAVAETAFEAWHAAIDLESMHRAAKREERRLAREAARTTATAE